VENMRTPGFRPLPKRQKTALTVATAAVVTVAVLATSVVVKSDNVPPAREITRPTAPIAYALVTAINAQNASLRLSPIEAARIMGYAMLASYSAWEGASKGVDKEIAAAVAGSETAAVLYTEPTRAAEIRNVATRYGATNAPDAVEYGMSVAQRTIRIARERGYDNIDEAWAPTQGTTSYPWQPTGRGEPGLEPRWGELGVIISGSKRCQLTPPTDTAIETEARAMLDSFDRTTAVGDDVMWWLAGTGTPTPAGQWMRLTLRALRSAEVDGDTAMRVLTRAAVAAADVGVVGWAEKYRHSVARPETVWEKIDASGAPTLPRETPNHPAYPSGHSMFGSAVSTALLDELGDVALNDQLPPDLYVPRQVRSWPSVSAALAEAGQSRVNAGFHYPLDIVAGQQLGRCVAEGVAQNLDAESMELR
jgi:membrane-associated phospholipid phosphatase